MPFYQKKFFPDIDFCLATLIRSSSAQRQTICFVFVLLLYSSGTFLSFCKLSKCILKNNTPKLD